MKTKYTQDMNAVRYTTHTNHINVTNVKDLGTVLQNAIIINKYVQNVEKTTHKIDICIW